MITRNFVSVLGLLIGIGSVFPLSASVAFQFPLSGDQEVPPVSTPASGKATVVLNTENNQVFWNLTYQDLKAPLTGAHFHGPAAPGANGNAFIDLSPLTGRTSGWIVGSATLTDFGGYSAHEWRDFILGGMTYINLHTDGSLGGHPDGEIRGQVIPEPGNLALLISGFVFLGILRHRFRCRK